MSIGEWKNGKVTFVVSSGDLTRTEDRAMAAHKMEKMVQPCARAVVRRVDRTSGETIRVTTPVAEGGECG